MSDEADDDVTAIETNDGRESFNPAHLGAPEKLRITKGRVYSETTRAAFKDIAEKNKGLEHDNDVDDLEPAIQTNDSAATGARPAESPAAAQDHAPVAAPISPVAQAADAIAAERAAQLEAREKELNDRESRLRDHKGRFKEDHVQTLKEMVREAHGLDEAADIKPYIMDLVTEMSGELLGLDVPDSVRAKQALKKTERMLKEHHQQLAKLDTERKESEQKQREADERRRTVVNIKAELAKPERAEKYKWLLASDEDGDPADLVYGVAEAIVQGDLKNKVPEDRRWKPSLDDAADRANKFYEAKARKSYERYKHLLNPAPTKQPNAAATPQERPPGSRSPRTLTNEQSAEAPARATNSGRPLTNEDRRRASMKRFASSIPADE